MPRYGLTYAAVEEAANRLTEQGVHPTVMRVREAVGGTGSLTTIANHLRDWRSALAGGGAEVTAAQGDRGLVAATVQAEVPRGVAELARSAWHRLSELATAEVDAVKVACAEEITAVQQAAEATCVQERARADGAIAEAHAALAVAEVRVAEVRQQAQQANQRLAAVQKEQAADAASQAHRFGEQQAAARLQQERIDDLVARLSQQEIRSQQAIEARDTAVARQRSSEAQCQARLDKLAHTEQQRLVGITTAFERTLANLQKQAAASLAQQRTAAEGLAASLAALGSTNKQLHASFAAAERQAQRMAERIEHVAAHQGELAELVAGQAERAATAQALERPVLALTGKVEALSSEVRTLLAAAGQLAERPTKKAP